jgi:hypothetical protein
VGVSNTIGCRNAAAPFINNFGLFDQNLQTSLCGKRSECGLRGYASTNRPQLEAIRNHLKTLPSPGLETTQRIKALRELYRTPKLDFEKSDCFRSSDALIASEAPASASILTKNRKHFEPICEVLSKPCNYF